MICTKEDISNLIREAELERLRSEIEKLAEPSIQMTMKKSRESDIPVGASKFGGLPDLPPGVEWPKCGDADLTGFMHQSYWNVLSYGAAPLWFICQIRMEDIAPYDVDNIFPLTGMLYFFSALHRAHTSFEGLFTDAWRVIYSADTQTGLRRAKLPKRSIKLTWAIKRDSLLSPKYILDPCMIDFNLSYTLPQNPEVGMTDEEKHRYYDHWWSKFWTDTTSPHQQLLGHCQMLQGTQGRMENEAESAVRHSEYPHDVKPDTANNSTLTIEQLEEGQKWWRLLMQLDSDSEIGLWLAGEGSGYFWISREGLASRNFDRVCLINQYT